MVGFAVLSFRENGWGGLVSQGLGTSMLQMGNIVRNPKIWIPAIVTSAITGPIATCVFKLQMNGAAVNSGMGTCGPVRPYRRVDRLGRAERGRHRQRRRSHPARSHGLDRPHHGLLRAPGRDLLGHRPAVPPPRLDSQGRPEAGLISDTETPGTGRCPVRGFLYMPNRRMPLTSIDSPSVTTSTALPLTMYFIQPRGQKRLQRAEEEQQRHRAEREHQHHERAAHRAARCSWRRATWR